MFDIKILIDEPVKQVATIQAVAAIETIIQPQDSSSYKTFHDLLEQANIDFLVVYQSDKVVSYCLYQVVFEQAEILRIGTYPDYQRQGIASRIFARLNKALEANQVESLLLEVRADNTAAIALYEQQGLAVIHTRKGYYQIPHRPAIDALIMQRIYV